jgi:hypothetical protein
MLFLADSWDMGLCRWQHEMDCKAFNCVCRMCARQLLLCESLRIHLDGSQALSIQLLLPIYSVSSVPHMFQPWSSYFSYFKKYISFLENQSIKKAFLKHVREAMPVCPSVCLSVRTGPINHLDIEAEAVRGDSVAGGRPHLDPDFDSHQHLRVTRKGVAGHHWG